MKAYTGKFPFAISSGSYCTAIGSAALSANTTGQHNTAVGSQALSAFTPAPPTVQGEMRKLLIEESK